MNAPEPADIDHALTLPDREAFARIEAWAIEGLAEAQAVLGQMLLDGRGTVPAPLKAFGWFLKAAKAGHSMAMNMVGRCYENGWGVAPDQETATGWFRSAAQKGLDWGMYNYATSLALGRGCEQDRMCARDWLIRAADLGHAKAMNLLGGFHEDGWTVPVDMRRARDLYEQAAQRGDFRGWFNLARFQLKEGAREAARTSLDHAFRSGTPAFRASMSAYLRAESLSDLEPQAYA